MRAARPEPSLSPAACGPHSARGRSWRGCADDDRGDRSHRAGEDTGVRQGCCRDEDGEGTPTPAHLLPGAGPCAGRRSSDHPWTWVRSNHFYSPGPDFHDHRACLVIDQSFAAHRSWHAWRPPSTPGGSGRQSAGVKEGGNKIDSNPEAGRGSATLCAAQAPSLFDKVCVRVSVREAACTTALGRPHSASPTPRQPEAWMRRAEAQGARRVPHPW